MLARLLGTADYSISRNQRLSDAVSHLGRRKAFRPGHPAAALRKAGKACPTQLLNSTAFHFT